MKISICLFLSLCATMASVDAADIRYQQSGNWTQQTAPGNIGVGWQGTTLPGSADTARINWGGNTVIVNTTVPTVSRVQIGVDESGVLEIAAGGRLTTSGEVRVGNNNSTNALAPPVSGTLTVGNDGILTVGGILWSANSSSGNININAGGRINAGNHLWLGVTGTSVITISGMLTQTAGILGLGTNNAGTATGGSAQVNIMDGGWLSLNNISGNSGQPSIQSGSILNLYGSGQLTLPGNFVSNLTGYVNAGKIVGNNTPGMSNLTIDTTTNPGFTTVRAIPESSSSVLLGLCGAIALYYRRK